MTCAFMKFTVLFLECQHPGCRRERFEWSNLFFAYTSTQGWEGTILLGLRGAAWKEKVASIESITQAVLSGEATGMHLCGSIRSTAQKVMCWGVLGVEPNCLLSSGGATLKSCLDSTPCSDSGNLLTPVIMVLAAHTKQFKDSNFNVLKASLVGITTLLEAAHAAGGAKGHRTAVSIVVTPAVEKLGDRKLQVILPFNHDNSSVVASPTN